MSDIKLTGSSLLAVELQAATKEIATLTAERDALRARLEVYEAATRIDFAANGTCFLAMETDVSPEPKADPPAWHVYEHGRALGIAVEKGLTRDAAIAKAFELSKKEPAR